jgi:hypothetical protein
MTTMIAELYDALLAAGSPEDKARKAAEAMAGYEAHEGRFVRIEADIGELKRDVAELKGAVLSIDRRLSALEGEVRLLKWMIGFVLAFLVAISIKLFVH